MELNPIKWFSKKQPEAVTVIPETIQDNVKQPEAGYTSTGTYRTLYSSAFTGEKNLGAIGPVKNYRPAYLILRLRSWQAYYESDVAKMIIGKLALWVIGKGLKLQSQPNKLLMQEEGINIDLQKFSRSVEARFDAFCSSTDSDYAGMISIDEMDQVQYLNAIIGGDVLVIQRYEKGRQTVQLIDGEHVRSPNYGNEIFPEVLPNGNKILNGVEFDVKGQHVAYYVAKSGLTPHDINTWETVRIPARTKTGLLVAWLEYGDKMRIDNVRGVPLMTTVLETLKTLDRYKEATVASAEERAKIVYTINRGASSSGASPLRSNLTTAFDFESAQLATDSYGSKVADKFAATTSKMVYDLDVDTEIKALESKNDLIFEPFFTVNTNVMCSALNIPPDVAKSLYNSNYSASRAAIKDFEHTLDVKRGKSTFKQNIYNFFLEIQILQNKIQAPGYLLARSKNDTLIVSSYRRANWRGANVPHIDPLKEVQAERLKLGASAAAIPLTTVEAAMARLDGGEFDSNVEQFAEELKKTQSLDIEDPNIPEPAGDSSDKE